MIKLWYDKEGVLKFEHPETCTSGTIEDPIRDSRVVAYLALGYTIPTEDISEYKQQKITEINSKCAETIMDGFISSALGEPYLYDSAEVDQLNLIGAISLNMDLPYRCTKIGTGSKEFYLHSAAQLRQVGLDGAMFKLYNLEKAATLKSLVNPCTTTVELSNISW